MTDGEETVYLIRSNGRRKMHTDPGCRILEGEDPLEYDRRHVPNYDECAYCSGEFETGGGGSTFAKSNVVSSDRPEGPNELVLDALETADVPMDTEALRYRTLLSEQQVRRSLKRLRDAGHVRQVRDPDDGRKNLYLPTGDSSTGHRGVSA